MMCALRAHDAARQHSAAQSPAPAAPQPAHRCGICGKAFDRRDLRDRHKRRCIHRFSKPKRSKRKSCLACAVSKLGCDQGQPSCRRCLSRNLPCEYVRGAADTAAEVDVDAGLPEPRGGIQGPDAGLVGPIAYDTQENDNLTRRLVELGESDTFLCVDDVSGAEDGSMTPSNQSISTVSVEENFFGGVGLPVGLTRAMDDMISTASPSLARSVPMAVPSNRQVNTNWNSGVDHGNHGGFPLLKHMAADRSSGNRLPYDSFGANEDMGWTGTHLDKRDMTFASLWSNIQGGGTHSSMPNSLGTSSASSSICRTGPVSSNNHDWSGRRNSRYTDGQTPKSPDRGCDVSMSPEDMVNIIMGYLPMMSTPDAPPFVHSQTYRHSKGPIARAMVCTHAFAGATPSSRSFAHDIVKAERDRLIKEFPQCSSDTDMLAALHAMVIYQALDLFSHSLEQTRSGELHQPFLLKMCRKVVRKHRRDLVHDAGNTAPSAWRYWCFVETLRRTVFLVHAINVLSTWLQKQDAHFYEALDDDLVLEMPLPAPAPLWEAGFEEEWLTRDSSTWRPTTGRMMQQEHMALPAGADAFTRIIVATLFDKGPPETGDF